jgi:cell fate (sporulation/competence/biofilm development) regulator YlbF (YheA/YmcA/DUF963 family)
MINVHDYAHNLARALKESPEHRAFAAAKMKIKGRPTAEKMIADFHQKQMELQAVVMQGKEPSKEQQEAVQQLYSIIQGDTDVREYLAVEQRLGTLLNDIYKIIGDAIETDLAPE